MYEYQLIPPCISRSFKMYDTMGLIKNDIKTCYYLILLNLVISFEKFKYETVDDNWKTNIN